MIVKAPTVICDRDVWDKLIVYSECTVEGTGFKVVSKKGGKTKYKASKSRIEISGLGIVEQTDESTFVIKDFLLLPSEGSVGSTEMDSEGIAKLTNELMEEERFEDIANMRLWWHTHPRGNLSWSGQDERQMAKFGSANRWPWAISIVTDGSGKYRARFDLFANEGGFRTYFDDIEIDIVDARDLSALREELQAEVDEKVKRSSFGSYKSNKKKGPKKRIGYIPETQTMMGYGDMLGDDDEFEHRLKEIREEMGGVIKYEDLTDADLEELQELAEKEREDKEKEEELIKEHMKRNSH